MGKRQRPSRGKTKGSRGTPRSVPEVLPVPTRPALLGAVVASAVSFAAYRWTLAPTVTLVDSGELILAAHTLGVAHPPGTPLYVILAHLATLLPLGSVALRVNMASAAFGAAAVGLLWLTVREATLAAVSPPMGHAGRSSETPAKAPAWVALAPVATAALSFAFSRTFWSYATVAEVYTLNTLLIVALVFLLLRWRRGRGAASLYAAAFLFGLSLGVHHVTVALTLPALMLLAWRGREPVLAQGRRLCVAAALALAGLVLVYAFLPWAASRNPVLAWGNPVSFERLLSHVMGRQYQSYFEFSGEAALREAGEVLRMISREFGPSLFPAVGLLAAAGFLVLWRTDRRMCGALTLLVATNVVFGLVLSPAGPRGPTSEDKGAYFLPTFLGLAVASAFGAQALLEGVRTRRRLVAAGLMLASLVPVVANRTHGDRRNDHVAEDYVTNVLAAVKPGGLLLTADWQLYSPLLYFREVEGLRRDVVAVDVLLLRRSWYFDTLARQFPAVMASVRSEVDAFLEDLTAWERDPNLYRVRGDLKQRINDRFLAVVRALALSHSGPVYATPDVLLSSPDPTVARLLNTVRTPHPRGLIFELRQDKDFHPPPAITLRTRGLFGESMRRSEDIATSKVRSTYLQMMVSHGLYLAAFGQHESAVKVYEETLALDPEFAPAREALARSRAARSTAP